MAHNLYNTHNHCIENNIYQLQDVVKKYPYFQSARALYLKGLYQQKSHLYNAELKKTAVYTTDRDVLFDFITSKHFKNYQPVEIENIEVFDQRYIEKPKPEPTLEENIEKSVLSTLAYIENTDKEEQLIEKIEQIPHRKIEKTKADIENKLQIGEPLAFDKSEKHSFGEWLQMMKVPMTVKQETQQTLPSFSKEENTLSDLEKKLQLIDRFIENNPKIIPSKHSIPTPQNVEKSSETEPSLMTETLAKIYLEQKKYSKAIQAYEILILKYPKKSGLFAEKIEYIRELQQLNN